MFEKISCVRATTNENFIYIFYTKTAFTHKSRTFTAAAAGPISFCAGNKCCGHFNYPLWVFPFIKIFFARLRPRF